MTDKQQHSSDMVERVAAIISRVVYEHEAIEPAAREILEASHHSELVRALRCLVEWLAPSGCRQRVLAEADAVLRKVDPDYALLDDANSHHSSIRA